MARTLTADRHGRRSAGATPATERWLHGSPKAQAELAFRQGVQAQAAGEKALAKAHFEQALAAWPGCAAAWANLGLLHQDAGSFETALACLERACELDPGLYAAALNLGTLQARLGQPDAAEAAFTRALALRPEAPAAWSSLGALLASRNRLDEGLACCWHALSLDPQHAQARFNLSYPLLRQGHYAEGFLCMEARESSVALQQQLPLTRWDGEPVGEGALLVVSDAGHGDVIQMCRYAPQLRARGVGRLIFCGQAGVQRLLQQTGAWDEVLRFDDPLPLSRCSAWTPLMSLPYHFGSTVQTLPGPGPYLHADPKRQALWRQRLQGEGPPGVRRIGLVWRGNPRHENDARRSLPHLSAFAPLASLPGVRLYGLQSGAGADEASDLPAAWPWARLEGGLGDFAETAALVANLDLVIGVDTSIVHLAGALGVPTWVLLSQHLPDWRWLDGRQDSPWYPGVMRLFRQPQAGDWAGCIAEVARALAAGA